MSDWLSDFLKNGACLRTAPGRAWLGRGPWQQMASPSLSRPSIYAPDFYLSDESSWFVPSDEREVPEPELRYWLETFAPSGASVEPPISWEAPEASGFEQTFGELQRRFREDGLEKAVPVVFEHGRAEDSVARRSSLLRKLFTARLPLIPYGFWDERSGMLGATPELLVENDGHRIRTMALAGTRRRSPEPWDDPKEIREHQLVVDDIVEALSPFGRVTTSERRTLRLPTLEHFLMEIDVETTVPISLETIVRALHPTPALGVAPRAYGYRRLKDLEVNDRGRFGAPFGISWPDGRFQVVVAIRNVQWRDDRWTLGAGCGVLRESRWEREWEELALKRRSVKGLLFV